MGWKSQKNIAVRFLHRILLFLTSFSFTLCLIFYYGNVQEFSNTSLFFVLRTLSFISLFASIISIFLFVLELVLLIHNKNKRYINLLVICVFCFCFTLGITLFSHIILFFGAGFPQGGL